MFIGMFHSFNKKITSISLSKVSEYYLSNVVVFVGLKSTPLSHFSCVASYSWA